VSDITVLDLQSVFLRGVARRWWVVALRGLAALVFGAVALLAPGVTLVVLVLWFAAYIAVDGVLAIGAGVAAMLHHKHGAALVAEGTLGLVVAIVLLAWPGIGIAVAVVLAAVWALVTGGALLWATVALPVLAGRILMGIVAAVSLVLGIALLVHPAAGAVALAIWLGAYASVTGLLMLGLAWQLRGAARAVPRAGDA
jgi:uncharacterized membrane protein HdeD (DUF308 family)